MPANFKHFFLSIVLFSVFGAPLKALDPFCSPSFLKNSMEQNDTLILDVRNNSQYKRGHIDHAINININDFIETKNFLKRIKSSKEVLQKLSDLGLQQSKNIFIYAQNNDKGIQTSTLFALILTLSGFEKISILDGGYMEWVFQNELLVSNKKFTLDPAHNNSTKIKNNIIVDTKYMQQNLVSSIVLDTREPSQYYGINKSPLLKKFGHIPHAKCAYYGYNFLHDGSLRDMGDLYAIYTIGDELKESDNIIVYGNSIFDASVDWYILSKYLQYKKVKVYAGSLLDWQINSDDLAMTKYKWE